MTIRGAGLRTLAAALAVMGGASARAGYHPTGFFVDHPTSNSRDWTSAVTIDGGRINNDVDFRAMTPGALNQSFYDTTSHDDGVKLFASDSSFGQVVAGHGPGQGGQDGPVSVGEGMSSDPEYLQSTSPGFGGRSSLTVSFSTPAMAVGLFIIDYFGSDLTTNQITLSIYSGQNGRGTLLGTATAARDNFQPDSLYFMGYVSTGEDIGSAVLTRGSDTDGDTIGIGSILFADGGGVLAVPEPSALALACMGGAILAGSAARRRRRAT
jgi:hypothetical protein